MKDETLTNKQIILRINKQIERTKIEITSATEELSKLKKDKETMSIQIKRLSELTQPVEHDTTYLVEDRFPPKMNKHLLKNNTNDNVVIDSKRSNKENYSKSSNTISFKAGIKKQAKSGEVMKLEKLLQHETFKVISFLQDMQLQLKIIEEDRHRTAVINNDLVEKLFKDDINSVAEVNKEEMQCFVSISELLKLRLNILIAQREEVEELEKLDNEKKFFYEKEKIAKDQVIIYYC